MQKSLFLVCFLLALFIPVYVAAQAPCYLLIRVIDAQSSEPIPGALLKLDGLSTEVYTDSLGQIRMPMSCGSHGVRFQLPGYKSFFSKIEVAGEMPFEAQMENINTQMEEVVVTSQGAVRTIETPALGVNVLSMRAVGKIVPAAGEIDIFRSLQTLPGISSVGEGANGINIRGGSVDQNLMLIDNMPIFNPTHLLGLFSVLPNDAIREIQIFKGSVPARYGGRNAGVLDIKMSEPSMEKSTFKGGIGLISNRVHVEVPLIKNKLAIMTSGRVSFNEYLLRFYNKVLYRNVFERQLPNSKPQFLDFANKLVWRPTDKDHISLTNYISYDSYRVFELYSIGNIVPKEATIKYGHNNTSLRWNHFFSERFNLNTQVVRSLYRTGTRATEVGAGFDFKTRLDYLNGKVEMTYAPSSKQRINMGITGTQYQLKPANLQPREGSTLKGVTLDTEKSMDLALFVADEYEINAHLLVELGLRYVNYWNFGTAHFPIYATDAPRTIYSITDTLNFGKNDIESRRSRWEPRLALRYKINAHSSVKIGYNRMNQFLQMVSNNTTPLPDVRWKTSNRYVPPAQSDLFSVGYFRDQSSRMWEWSVEAYYRKQGAIYDYLSGAALSINPVVETQMVQGRAKAYGAELLVNKKKGVMTGWMSYTYARSFQQVKSDFAGQSLNGGAWFRTNVDKPHNLNLVLSFQNEKHNALAFTFVYSTGRPYTAPVGFYRNDNSYLPIYDDRNNARISDYHRLDAAWTITNPSMKKRRGESSWVVAFYNLYGRRNAFSYFFDPGQRSFKPFKVSVFPSPIFSLSFNYKYGKNT